MKKSSWQYYSVKLVYQAVISGSPIQERVDEKYSDAHTFFEESLVLVKAQSFEHAYALAERNALKYRESYRNTYGQTIAWNLVTALDCYAIGDVITNGIELYSAIAAVDKKLTPGDYVMKRYGHDIDDYEWNDSQRAERIRLQTVLTLEAFSKWRKPSPLD